MTDLPAWAQQVDADLTHAHQQLAAAEIAASEARWAASRLAEQVRELQANLNAARAALTEQRNTLADRVGDMSVQATDEATRVFCENLARELRRA